MKSKSLYQGKKEFYTDPVNGRFNRIRLFTMSFIVLCFFIIPWITWNNHQAFLFDVLYNRFYVFGSVFWPQDFVLIAIFFIFCVIALFAITLYSGRIWCGFLCPQSIWIKMSVFLTRIFEGKKNARIKLQNTSISFYKVLIKILKHISWIFLSFLTGFTFVGYFISIRELMNSLIIFDMLYPCFFWIMFFSFLTYFNIGWFKEQFCFLVCPYARLQSVMFDENTLIVSYDRVRGEKRGPRQRLTDYRNLNLGDCIDCKKCVTCCPTGIDIRDGLQMECISCGACVDACNDVMNKMGYKQDLISFRRENDVNFLNTRYSRIKLFLYSCILCVLFCLFAYFLITRPLFFVSVTRGQYQLFNVTKDNFVENYFFVKVMNKSDNESKYQIFIDKDIFEIQGIKDFVLKPGEFINIDLILKSRNYVNNKKFADVTFSVLDVYKKKYIQKRSKFVFPDGDF